MTTMRSALRGVKMLRWWRNHGIKVANAILGVLIVCSIFSIVKLATDLNMEKGNAVPPSAESSKVKEKTTIINLETISVSPVETSSSENNIQQYMAEQIEISQLNYYSAGNREEAGYCVTVVESSEPSQEEKVYTYLGRTYTWEDIENLARIAWFEQGICGKEMTQLAAAVLINRSHWSEFGSTYLECFYQAGQYSNYTIQRYESSEEIPDEVYDWIVELLNCESEYGEVPTTVVYQAQFPQGIATFATSANTYICYADENLLGEYIP